MAKEPVSDNIHTAEEDAAVLSFKSELDDVVDEYLGQESEKFADPEQEKRIKDFIDDFLRGDLELMEAANKLLAEAYTFHKKLFMEEDSEVWEVRMMQVVHELEQMKVAIDKYKGEGPKATYGVSVKLQDVRNIITSTIQNISRIAAR